MFQNQIVR